MLQETFFCTFSYHVQVPGVWDHLARASVARFPALERASGIKIHKTSGYLGVAGPRFVGFEEWRKASRDFEEKGQAKVNQRSDIGDHQFYRYVTLTPCQTT